MLPSLTEIAQIVACIALLMMRAGERRPRTDLPRHLQNLIGYGQRGNSLATRDRGGPQACEYL